MSTLDQARKALIGCQQKIEAYAGFSQTSQQLAIIADYLDSQVPLAVEVEQLRIKLAYAESFVSKINALTSQHVDQANEAVRAATMTALCGGPALMGDATMVTRFFASHSSPPAKGSDHANVIRAMGVPQDNASNVIYPDDLLPLTPEQLEQMRKDIGDV